MKARPLRTAVAAAAPLAATLLALGPGCPGPWSPVAGAATARASAPGLTVAPPFSVGRASRDVELELRLANPGDATETISSLAVTLGLGMSYVRGSSRLDSGVFLADPRQVHRTLLWAPDPPLRLAGGTSASLRLTVRAPSGPGNYVLTAAADATPQPMPAPAPAVVNVASPVQVSATADTATVAPGGSDGYTVTVANPNLFDVTVGSVTEQLSGGFAFTGTGGRPVHGRIGVRGPIHLPALSALQVHLPVRAGAAGTVTAGVYATLRPAAGDLHVAVWPSPSAAPVQVERGATRFGFGRGFSQVANPLGPFDLGGFRAAPTYPRPPLTTIVAPRSTQFDFGVLDPASVATPPFCDSALSLSATEQPGIRGQPVTLTLCDALGGDYRLDFGDGHAIVGRGAPPGQFQHTYARPGLYLPKLTVSRPVPGCAGCASGIASYPRPYGGLRIR